MKFPKFISKGSVIGVVAPSDGADNELKVKRFKNACKKLESLGYKIKLSDNVFNSFMGRSTNEKQRAKEFNEMVSDNSVDLIMCASGGEFLLEILPYVDFELLENNPKFVCGFSDPTGLLYPITTKYDIATIYGKNFSSFGMEEYHKSEEDFLKIINGIDVVQDSYEKYEGTYLDKVTGLESYNLDSDVKWMTVKDEDIFIRGRIIGGCFDIISDLAGTKYDGINEFNEKYKSDGIIWYFDNCEISMEETIRTLWKMNELDSLTLLVISSITTCFFSSIFGFAMSHLLILIPIKKVPNNRRDLELLICSSVGLLRLLSPTVYGTIFPTR